MWSSGFTSARIIVADAPPMLTLAFAVSLISGGLAGWDGRVDWGKALRLTAPTGAGHVCLGLCKRRFNLGLVLHCDAAM